MIYYLKQEVKIGQKIDLNGIKITLTQEIINDNPNMFEVKEDIPKYVEVIKLLDAAIGWWSIGDIYKVLKWKKYYVKVQKYNGNTNAIYFQNYFKPSTKEAYERQGLLKEAKKRYPVGTRFISALDHKYRGTVSKDLVWHAICTSHITNGPLGASVYACDKWAEIVPKLFTTEDDIDIYEGDEYWIACPMSNFSIQKESSATINWRSKDWGYKYFSTKEAAEIWIRENKPREKTLEDYENELFTLSGFYETQHCTFTMDDFYRSLKEFEPKLYWLKVLQLIADDLNGDWIPKLKEQKAFIYFSKTDNKWTVSLQNSKYSGIIYFKSVNYARKAIELIGSNLNYL